MSRTWMLLAATSLVTLPVPVLAQHSGHGGMTMPMPMPAKKPVAKKKVAKKAPAKKAIARKPGARKAPARKPALVKPVAADPQAGHDMLTMEKTTVHTAPPADDGAMVIDLTPTEMPAADPPVQPPPPAALTGPVRAADALYGAAAMAGARATMMREHGGAKTSKLMVERAEWRFSKGRDAYAIEGGFRWGGDIDRLVLTAEVDGERGHKAEIEGQARWSHALDPWFDLQAGVRHDFRGGRDRSYALVGVHGVAPGWIEVGGFAYLSSKGDVSGRVEASHDARITDRLIVQPSAEFDFALSDDRASGIGRGPSAVEAGLRLRYQVAPEFAPYVGVNYERKLSRTARFARDAGEDVGGLVLVAGVRAWF